MRESERHFLGLGPGGFHKVVYDQWGDGHVRRIAVCVHGLTRNASDFAELAPALAAGGWRVLCPDVVGRGRSGRLADPAWYGWHQYLSDMTALIARSGAEQVDWVGTSMGGLIGMMLAAQPNSPIRRLVLNDVGPAVGKAALRRIGTYVGKRRTFADHTEAEAYFREVNAPFGCLTDAQWRRMALANTRPGADGRLELAYDPGIAHALNQGELTDIDLWPIWDAIRCPVLVLRGAESDLLLADVAERMKARGPRATVIEIAGCGHAPALMSADQVALVRAFLSEG